MGFCHHAPYEAAYFFTLWDEGVFLFQGQIFTVESCFDPVLCFLLLTICICQFTQKVFFN